jgi:2'-5' RNA ligase
MRLFVAARLAAELQARLGALQQELRGLQSRVRWVRPEDIHLTFVFLGEVAAERLAPVRQAVEAAADEGPPAFRLRGSGVGAFPVRGPLRVVWVGLDGDLAAATRLKQALEGRLAACGFRPEQREFVPHLTLGRVGRERGRDDRAILERHRAVDLGELPVDAVHLIESRLSPDGARYEALAGFPLRTAA